jgi:hypothetical protein
MYRLPRAAQQRAQALRACGYLSDFLLIVRVADQQVVLLATAQLAGAWSGWMVGGDHRVLKATIAVTVVGPIALLWLLRCRGFGL